MYDIRQFKPTLYVLVMLGVVGFTLAAQAPALFVLAGAAIGLNAWLVATGRFTPMPRWLANGITLLAFLYVAQQVFVLRTTPIIIVGQFLVLLQIAKLFEQRANRDYAQLLVLSLLLMVAASITTASLLFGVLLIGYLFLSLYCCLLFHLKVETDHAKNAYALSDDRINPAMLRQDQRHLSRSMRRLTGLVSAVAIFGAVVVFLVFPRGTGANLLGPLQLRPSQTLTGFSDRMSFQQIANITQNTSTVAYVKVWKDGRPLQGTETLYLRGVTLDAYSGSAESGWQWSRTGTRGSGIMGGGGVGGRRSEQLDTGEVVSLAAPEVPGGAPVYRQEISLLPTGTPTLFALPYPAQFKASRPMRLAYNQRDGLIAYGDPLVQKIDYEVTSTDPPVNLTSDQLSFMVNRPARSYQSNIDPRIASYVKQIGIDDLLRRRAEGPNRKQGWEPNALDEEIARAIERHFHSQFEYTLDLTEFGRTHDDDPIVRFLYDFKRGHCEYFAGAMTLLCQSLDMRSRVVTGFKCDEYSEFGQMYTVRQSHAHAWVEVLTPNGWRTFDPTSGRGNQSARTVSLWQRAKGLMNFLEFQWGNSVIGYDNDNRESLITNVNTRLDQTAVNSSQTIARFTEWVQDRVGVFASRVVGPIVALLVGGLLFSVAWFLWERMRLRRRAERIGLDVLPSTDQIKLLRQLGFYDDMLRLLERHSMTRPPHQTPKEFADSLAHLPSEVYDTVNRLTGIFYKIRFGRRKLTAPQQRRLHTVLVQLADRLGVPPQATLR